MARFTSSRTQAGGSRGRAAEQFIPAASIAFLSSLRSGGEVESCSLGVAEFGVRLPLGANDYTYANQ